MLYQNKLLYSQNMNNNLIVGTYIDNVEGVLFIDPETNRLRIKTIGNISIQDGILIECRKKIREDYPVGTYFYTEDVKVCKKSDGRIYVRAKDQMIYPK